jgi:hypothetical protein
MKREKPPTRFEIVEYWSANQNEIEANECRMGADEADWIDRCWCCAIECKQERCHIIPHSLGGSNHPSNFVLLCSFCHQEAPNVADKYLMWDWIAENRSLFYLTKEEMEDIKSMVREELNLTTNHFGHKLNRSTKEWVSKRVSDNFFKKHGL